MVRAPSLLYPSLRLCVRHDVAEASEWQRAESGACGCGNTVGLTSIIDHGQFFLATLALEMCVGV